MKTILCAAALSALVAPAFARDTYVAPHVTKNGTYVQGHSRSAPDGNVHNNYSTQGNTNPYTGQAGTVNPYNQPNSFGGNGNAWQQTQPAFGSQR